MLELLDARTLTGTSANVQFKINSTRRNAIGESIITAHRGFTDHHLENTLEALRAACEAGIEAVEFDVRRTGDGEWVMFHDVDLMRLHSCDLVLAEQPLARLRQHAQLPLLDEALHIFDATCAPLVEVKEVSADGGRRSGGGDP